MVEPNRVGFGAGVLEVGVEEAGAPRLPNSPGPVPLLDAGVALNKLGPLLAGLLAGCAPNILLPLGVLAGLPVD